MTVIILTIYESICIIYLLQNDCLLLFDYYYYLLFDPISKAEYGVYARKSNQKSFQCHSY